MLVHELALTSQRWTPFYNFNLFYLLMQLIVVKRLSKAGPLRFIFVAKYFTGRGEGRNNMSLKQLLPRKNKNNQELNPHFKKKKNVFCNKPHITIVKVFCEAM